MTEQGTSHRTRNIAVGVLALLIGIGGGVFVSTLGDDDAGDEQVAGEIILSPAADVGADPFNPDPLAAAPDPTLAQTATPISTPITAPAGQQLTGSSGGTAGLYGGTQDSQVCDAQKMVDFLAANPDKAAAWVAALDADPTVALPDGRRLTVALIPEYVATLTPLVLREDTRVTNHGFKNAKPTKLQSTLQKGTSVLVDQYGVPRVKCFCGNPLLPPVASKDAPKYTGSKWPDFDPAKLSVIQPNTTIISSFVVTDLKTGKQFTLPAGTKITTPSSTTTTTAGPTTTASTTTTAPPTTAAPTTAVPTTQAPTTAPPTSAPDRPCPFSDPFDQVTFSIVNARADSVAIDVFDEQCNRVDSRNLAPGERVDSYSYIRGGKLSAFTSAGQPISSFQAAPGATWTIS